MIYPSGDNFCICCFINSCKIPVKITIRVCFGRIVYITRNVCRVRVCLIFRFDWHLCILVSRKTFDAVKIVMTSCDIYEFWFNRACCTLGLPCQGASFLGFRPKPFQEGPRVCVGSVQFYCDDVQKPVFGLLFEKSKRNPVLWTSSRKWIVWQK